MRCRGMLIVLLCLVLAGGCSSGRKVGLLQEDTARPKEAKEVPAEETPFETKLDEYMQLPDEVRADLREQAEAKVDYYQRLDFENRQYEDSKKRFWYYTGVYIDHSTRGVGLSNSMVGLKAATGLDPSYAEAWGVMGTLFMASGDPRKAREYLDNAREAAMILRRDGHPLDDEIMLRIYQDRAWVLRELTLWEEGLKAVDEGLTFKRGDQDLVLIKGLLLAGAGRYSDAVSLAVRMPPYEFPKIDYWHYGQSKMNSDFASRWIRSQALMAVGDYTMARQVLGDLGHREDQLHVPHMARFWSDAGLVAELAGEKRGSRYYALGFISRPFEGFYPWQGSNLHPLVLDVPNLLMPVYTSYGGKFLVGGSILTYAASQMNMMTLSVFEKQKQTAAARALFALNIAERRNIRPEVCRAMRGRIYYSSNDRAAARTELEAAREVFVQQGKVDAGTSLLIGMLEMGDGNNQEAIALLNEAVEKDEKLAAGWRTLGVLYAKAGNRLVAEHAMNKALQLDPNSVSGLYNRGLLRLQDKRFVESVADLEKAWKLDPENHEVQRVLQMAATSYRANGGDPSQLRLQVEQYQVAAVSDGPPVDLVADPAALVAQMNAEITAFFSVPDSIAATLSRDDEVLTTLALKYQETGDPNVRRALALAYMDRGMNLEAQALLAPGWGVDLLAGEEIMLLFVDRLLGQRERADALAQAMISGDSFFDYGDLDSVSRDPLRVPWWSQPMGDGHHPEGYSASAKGSGYTAMVDFYMGLDFNEYRGGDHRNLGYRDPMLNRWFSDIDPGNNTQASVRNGGNPEGQRKGSGGRGK
jgi:tetratricopeptide (TPR) repeat protein